MRAAALNGILRPTAVLSVAMLVSLGGPGHAAGDEGPAPSNLRVSYALGAETCPTAAALQASLVAQDIRNAQGAVRYAPFGERAFSAEVVAYGQTKFLTDPDCGKLLQQVTLALALIVPLAVSPTPSDPPVPASPGAPRPSARGPSGSSPVPPPLSLRPQREAALGGIHLGGLVAGGLSRSPLLGLSLGGWLRAYRPLSLGAAVSFYASDGFDFRGSRVENDLWGVTMEACVSVWERAALRVATCGGGSIMDMQTRGTFFADNRLNRFVRAAVLGAWQVAFEPILGLAPGFRGAIDVPLIRKSYDTLQGDRIWLMPPFSVTVTAQINYLFR